MSRSKCLRAAAAWLAAVALLVAASAAPAQVLWTVTASDGRINWLVGTLHSDDARVLDFPPALVQAIAQAECIALELAPEPEVFAELDRRMRLPDGETLGRHVPGPLLERALELLIRRGLERGQALNLRPWAAAMILSLPPAGARPFMDIELALRGRAHGARVVGLESVTEQVDFLAGLGREAHLDLLEQAVVSAEAGYPRLEALTGAWLAGDLEQIEQLTAAELEALDPEARSRFIERGLVDRNLRMRDRAVPLLEAGAALIAVGALHLVGEHGLIALLRQRGYRIEAVY